MLLLDSLKRIHRSRNPPALLSLGIEKVVGWSHNMTLQKFYRKPLAGCKAQYSHPFLWYGLTVLLDRRVGKWLVKWVRAQRVSDASHEQTRLYITSNLSFPDFLAPNRGENPPCALTMSPPASHAVRGGPRDMGYVYTHFAAQVNAISFLIRKASETR